MKPSKSPERNTFQKNAYIKRCEEEGREPSAAYINLYESEAEADDAWSEQEDHSNDMEWDLRTTDWILEKVRNSEAYAQNLYAAICNNEFQRCEVFPILAGQTCSYSWRYAGGIIADMRQEGDYIDWYCSGIRGEVDDEEYRNMSKEAQEEYLHVKNNYVAESVVTEEIKEDLKKLGWIVLDNNDDIV